MDGEKTITAKELLAERVLVDGAKTAAVAFKAMEAVRQAERARRSEVEEPARGGVILVPAPARNMEEALLAAGADRAFPAPEPHGPAPPPPLRGPSYPSPAPQDPVEERVYGHDSRAGPGDVPRPREQSPGLLAPPSTGRSLKADGTLR